MHHLNKTGQNCQYDSVSSHPLKNHRREGDQDFIAKIVYRHCFSWVMYGVCNNITLYSTNLSLIYFSTGSFCSQRLLLFWIKSLPGVTYKSDKKACKLALKSSKQEEITFPHEFIFCLPPISLGWCSQKKCQKSVVCEKGEPIERGSTNILHTKDMFLLQAGQ